MHSVRLKPTKLILIGTRTGYQTTGDASYIQRKQISESYNDDTAEQHSNQN